MRARLLTLAAFVAVAVPAAPAGARPHHVSPGCSTHACAQRVCGDACKERAAARTRARRPMSSAVASWYGPGLYGNRTACGQTLSPGLLGVAHKGLRCGTVVTICARACAAVPVVDRGPFVAGRTFDLTAATRARIGAGSLGVVRWRLGR